jgi:4a-hydroxytetrahydrobiopterin dehydratase
VTALLSDDERATALADLADWSWHAERRGIARSLRFADFGEAFGFMAQVAIAAERVDHHPEWSNVWNKVDILLTTHSAGGLTHKDIALARIIDRIAG